MGNLLPMVIVPVVFGSVIWVTYLIVNGVLLWHRRRLSAQIHQKLLDRFGSAHEFDEFVRTDGGRAFIESLTVERGTMPHERILRAVQSGVTVLFLGIALLLVRGPVVARGLPTEIDPVLTLFGAIAVAVGLGLLVSSVATLGLSRRFGLLDDHKPQRTDATSA